MNEAVTLQKLQLDSKCFCLNLYAGVGSRCLLLLFFFGTIHVMCTQTAWLTWLFWGTFHFLDISASREN